MRFATAPVLAAFVVVLAALFGSGAASAQGAEWCANFDTGSSDCSYYTFQECERTISGAGGTCSQNLRPSTNEPEPTPILPLPRWFGGDHPERDYSVPPPPGLDPLPTAPPAEPYAPAPPGYPPPPSR